MSLSKELLGKRISDVRKAKNLTRANLSEMIGISEKYLSRVESGKQTPSVIVVTKICEALCVSTDSLLSMDQITYLDNGIQNELINFSIDEQKQIVEIIKLIKAIKN